MEGTSTRSHRISFFFLHRLPFLTDLGLGVGRRRRRRQATTLNNDFRQVMIATTLLLRRTTTQRIFKTLLVLSIHSSSRTSLLTEAMIPSSNLPLTMKAAQGADYGDIDEMITVKDGVSVPSLASLPAAERRKKMLIKVLAVALAPGDCRVLSGKTRTFQGPPSFPYVPGGDCCGIVMELPAKEPSSPKLPFGMGDRVAVRFDGKPNGALGEYALVSTRIAEKVPDSVGSDEAAALASATPATVVADCINPGERVLVLGAGGGVGSHFIQLIRERGASYIVGTSKRPGRLTEAPILCDRAIDYTKEDVLAMDEYIKKPFDVIVDFASGSWPRLVERSYERKPLVVKAHSSGGRYITTSPDQPTFELSTIWQMMNVFLFPALWRAAVSRTWYRSNLPSYSFAMALPDDHEVMTRTLNLAKEGKLKAVMDPQGPFPLTTKGVCKAFRIVESRHAQGKVVIHVADDAK